MCLSIVDTMESRKVAELFPLGQFGVQITIAV
jgi:hypothetical protein